MAAPKGNKNAGRGKGRPTKYKPEYCEKVIKWGKEGKSRTWIAAALDTSRETLDNWAKANPDFFDALSRAKAHEQRWWEDAGQAGMTSDKFNGGVWSKNMAARFPAEWRDNSKVEVAGDPQKPLRHELGIAWMTEEDAKARGWA
jgi:transposase